MDAPSPASPEARKHRDRTPVPDRSRTDYGADCLSAGCHARLAESPWVHGPVTVGACAQCHEPAADRGEHRFRPARPGRELCTFCHREPKPLESVHEVYAKGDCTACHDPHGGPTRALLAAASERELCHACHAPETHRAGVQGGAGEDAAFAFLHQPVTEGKCLTCHAAHQSRHAALLISDERTLCLSCHPKTAEVLAASSYVHEPAASGCVSCHRSHGSDEPRLLRADLKSLCTSCHQEVAASAKDDPHLHGALAEEGSCARCHVPHAGSSPALAVAPLSGACLACHDREVADPSGRRIADIAAQLAGAKYMHGAVAKGDCQACHRSHTSPHRALLASDYPTGAYIEFSVEKYQACFACHDARLATEEETALTGFRDGLRNLHYVHVHREKGRSCRLCHSAHAADGPALMLASVDFGPGGWKLPIGFRKEADGGSCVSGCHKEMSYRRPGPASTPSEPPPEVGRDPPDEPARKDPPPGERTTQ